MAVETANSTEAENTGNSEAERMARAAQHAETFLKDLPRHGDEPSEEPEVQATTEAEKPDDDAEENAENAEKTEEKPASVGLAAVVKAQQKAEAKLAAKEEAIAKREAEVAAREEKLKTEGGSLTDFHKFLRRNPSAALKAAGVTDMEGWFRHGYYQSLPEDKRPRDYKVYEQLQTYEEELAEQKAWRSKKEAEDAQRAKEAEEAKTRADEEQARAEGRRLYQADLEAELEKLPTTMRYLPVIAAENKAAVVEDMYRAAEGYFAEHGEPPTPAKAAELLEAAIAARMKPFEKHLTLHGTKPAAPDVKKAATRTLTAGKTATPTKPRPPATTEKERIARASEIAKGIWR